MKTAQQVAQFLKSVEAVDAASERSRLVRDWDEVLALTINDGLYRLWEGLLPHVFDEASLLRARDVFREGVLKGILHATSAFSRRMNRRAAEQIARLLKSSKGADGNPPVLTDLVRGWDENLDCTIIDGSNAVLELLEQQGVDEALRLDACDVFSETVLSCILRVLSVCSDTPGQPPMRPARRKRYTAGQGPAFKG